jgi:four helix bundle protein
VRKKTPKAQCSTSNIEWLTVREGEGAYGNRAETFNVQHPTSNVQRGSERRFDLEERRLLEFSARIILNTRAANHIAGQLLRCGTSPLGNQGEVQAAESRRDFIHKLRICLKEFKETRRWLRLLQRSRLGKGGAHQNLRCERSHRWKEREMNLRLLHLNVGHWALSVGRSPLRLNIERWAFGVGLFLL